MNVKFKNTNENSYQVKDIAHTGNVSTDAIHFYTKKNGKRITSVGTHG